jgi:hypothetical protein
LNLGDLPQATLFSGNSAIFGDIKKYVSAARAAKLHTALRRRRQRDFRRFSAICIGSRRTNICMGPRHSEMSESSE